MKSALSTACAARPSVSTFLKTFASTVPRDPRRRTASCVRRQSAICCGAHEMKNQRDHMLRGSRSSDTLARPVAALLAAAAVVLAAPPQAEARTQKPALHGAHWMAVTGKPLAATAGAMIFERGGNAVDAAC